MFPVFRFGKASSSDADWRCYGILSRDVFELRGVGVSMCITGDGCERKTGCAEWCGTRGIAGSVNIARRFAKTGSRGHGGR